MNWLPRRILATLASAGTRGVRAFREQNIEPIFVEDRNSQLGRPVELGSGVFARDEEVSLLGHRARRLAATELDLRCRLVSGVPLQRAGHHNREPIKRTGPALDRILDEPHTGVSPLLNDFAMPLDREPVADRRCNRRSDTLRGRELLLRGARDSVDRL